MSLKYSAKENNKQYATLRMNFVEVIVFYVILTHMRRINIGIGYMTKVNNFSVRKILRYMLIERWVSRKEFSAERQLNRYQHKQHHISHYRMCFIHMENMDNTMRCAR